MHAVSACALVVAAQHGGHGGVGAVGGHHAIDMGKAVAVCGQLEDEVPVFADDLGPIAVAYGAHGRGAEHGGLCDEGGLPDGVGQYVAHRALGLGGVAMAEHGVACDVALGIDIVVVGIGAGGLWAGLLEGLGKGLHHVGVHVVVTAGDAEIAALSGLKCLLQAVPQPAVCGVADKGDMGQGAGAQPVLNDRHRIIGREVVNDDELQVLATDGLGGHSIEALAHKGPVAIDRAGHGDEGASHGTKLLTAFTTASICPVLMCGNMGRLSTCWCMASVQGNDRWAHSA